MSPHSRWRGIKLCPWRVCIYIYCLEIFCKEDLSLHFQISVSSFMSLWTHGFSFGSGLQSSIAFFVSLLTLCRPWPLSAPFRCVWRPLPCPWPPAHSALASFLVYSVLQAHLPCCACSATQSCLTVCNPMDCGPPGSSVHGISQARTLEGVAVSSSIPSSCRD